MKSAGLILILIVTSAQALWGSSGFVDLPEGCLNRKAYPCLLRATNSSVRLEHGAQIFTLAEKASMQFFTKDEFQILDGSVWVNAAVPLVVRLPGEVKVHWKGEFLVDSPRVFENESLPVGFENWYGKITTAGWLDRGMIKPIAAGEFVKQWAPFSGLSVADAHRKILFFKEAWEANVGQASDLYQEVVRRRMASVEEKEHLKQDQAEKARQERQTFKKLYRQKNYLDQ